MVKGPEAEQLLAKEADAGMIEMFAGDYLDNAAQTVAKLLKK